MLDADQYVTFRQRVIDNFDVYDLVEFLNLTVEDWLDNTTGWEENLALMEAVGYGPSDETS